MYINIICIITFVDVDIRTFLEDLGWNCFNICLEEYDRELRSIGSSLEEFFINLDDLKQHSKHYHINEPSEVLPSFRCSLEQEGSFILYMYSSRIHFTHFLCGLIKAAASQLFLKPGYVEVIEKNHLNGIIAIKVTAKTLKDRFIILNPAPKTIVSSEAKDNKISTAIMCRSFPFHLVFDRNMKVIQLGGKLMKLICPHIQILGLSFQSYFQVLKPAIEPVFNEFLSRVNVTFQMVCVQNVSAEATHSKVRNIEFTAIPLL